MMSVSPTAQAADVNMAEVRRLASEPVEMIFAGAPIGRISDADYWKTVRGSAKPVVAIPTTRPLVITSGRISLTK